MVILRCGQCESVVTLDDPNRAPEREREEKNRERERESDKQRRGRKGEGWERGETQ